MNKLQKDDVIVIRDYSYAGRIGPDGMTHNGNCEPHAWQKFKVLITNCAIPTYMLGSYQRIADTVVVGLEDGIVWFVKSNCVRIIESKHKIIIAGKTIELSHESFENLKKQLI